MLLTLIGATPAFAHPLGNFTINHLTKIDARDARINVRYVLDIAEIPSFQIVRDITANAALSPQQTAAWGASQARATLPQLHLDADGNALPLVLDAQRAAVRNGAGGLTTLYLVVDAHAGNRGPARSISFRDDTFAGRIGWRDVSVAPNKEPTHELTRYPAALLGSPPNVTAVALKRSAAGQYAVVSTAAGVSDAAQSTPSSSAARTNQLSDMLAKGTSDPALVLLTLLVAVALGALHALEPGHGKTLLAVTLVGARATVGQAAILAGSLTFAHTAAVLALGLAINTFKGYIVPETIYPWITLFSGAAIAIIGARAVAAQLRTNVLAMHPREHLHEHQHDGAHPHDHPHRHAPGVPAGHHHGTMSDEEHARLHTIPGQAPMRFGSTVWAAMSGGIAPCPAALVVLLAAISLNEVLYGVIVIVAFSFGLAVMLTGIGIAVVRGAGTLSKFPAFARVTKYGPLASATIMAGIGCILLGQGFHERGFDLSPYAVASLAALAIGGYAVTQAFGHRHAEAA